MYLDTYWMLEKLAISEEGLTRLARLEKQRYGVPKSLSRQATGPQAGGFPWRVKEPRLRFGRDTSLAGGSLGEYEKLLTRHVPTKAARKALLGDRRVILMGPRGGTGNTYLASMQRLAEQPVRKLSGAEKALFSRLFWAHEGMEQAVKKHIPGLPGHAAPEVLVKETNLLNTLTGVNPTAKRTAQTLLGRLRKEEPMTRLQYSVAGSPFEWTYGQGARNLHTGAILPRVSRHHRKAINSAAEKLVGGLDKKSLFIRLNIKDLTAMTRTKPAPLLGAAQTVSDVVRKTVGPKVLRKAVLKF